MTDSRTPVAILGATGLVGQHLVRLLDTHPTLRAAELFASDRSAGFRYGEAVVWALEGRPPVDSGGRVVRAVDTVLTAGAIRSELVLSALPGQIAREVEPALARRGHLVCTNASPHRMTDGVPLVVPEVNHAAISGVRDQDGRGGIVANPNCVVSGLALALAPLQAAWGIVDVTVVTLQALSGAGITGAKALDFVGNVVPHIPGEAEKIGPELGKILEADFPVAVAVNRVPVLDGHLAHVFASLRGRPSVDEVKQALRSGRGLSRVDTPSLDVEPISLVDDVDRPQPRLDIGVGRGMTVTVGQVRQTPLGQIAFSVVSHNAVRGAAGGCLANAELLLAVPAAA